MFLSKLPRWWVDVDRKQLYLEMRVTNFIEKMWLDIAIFSDECHENEGLWVFQKERIHWMTSLEHIGDTEMSWQHWPKIEVKVWWTVKNITQPKSHDDGVKVSSSRVTYYQKVFCYFSQIFLSHYWLVPLYFLTSLRRVTYAWSIIRPFGWIHNYLMI